MGSEQHGLRPKEEVRRHAHHVSPPDLTIESVLARVRDLLFAWGIDDESDVATWEGAILITVEKLLVQQQAEMEELRKDKARLDWLNGAGHWLEPHSEDAIKAFHGQRKQAHFYINGVYTVKDGSTARGAIDAAMQEPQ